MGSSLRRFSGSTSNMYKLLVCSFLAMAAAAPIEDTPEVAEAKATFKAAFDAAEAGEHAALRPDALHPVNNDVQAPQIASAYLDDVEDVAAAKADFQAAFDDAALLALQRCNLSAKAQVFSSNIPEVCERKKGERHHEQHHSCGHHGVGLNQPGGNHLSLTVSGGVPHRDWQGASHRASHLLPLDFHHDHVDNCDRTQKL